MMELWNNGLRKTNGILEHWKNGILALERKRNNRNDGMLEYWNTGKMEDWVEEEKDGMLELEYWDRKTG